MPSSSSTPERSSGRPRRSLTKRDRLDSLRRLTARDRLLLAWLAEHYVLSAAQISQAPPLVRILCEVRRQRCGRTLTN